MSAATTMALSVFNPGLIPLAITQMHDEMSENAKSGFVTHSHTHRHDVSGSVEHSFKKGTGEELRGFLVDRQKALSLAQGFYEILKSLEKSYLRPISEFRKKVADYLNKEVNESVDEYRKNASDKREKLRDDIQKLKSYGKRFWSDRWVHSEEINKLEMQLAMIRHDKFHYSSYWDYIPNGVSGHTDRISDLSQQVRVVMDICKMSVEDNLQLSPQTIQLLSRIEDGSEEYTIHYLLTKEYEHWKEISADEDKIEEEYSYLFKWLKEE